MKIPLFQIDAFASKLFQGNPASVCLLERWLKDDWLQKIAAENNKPATAFIVTGDNHDKHDIHEIRWFLPSGEINLCGHGLLAAAHVLWQQLGDKSQILNFQSRSGLLTARKKVEHDVEKIEINLPARTATIHQPPQRLLAGLKVEPKQVLAYIDERGLGNYMAVYENEEAIRTLSPDWDHLAGLSGMGVIVTAAGQSDSIDFVSRYFVPGYGIPEDHVTGSAHCTLIPYWADQLNKTQLEARQLSERGGALTCSYLQDSITIAGQAVCYMKGTIQLPIS